MEAFVGCSSYDEIDNKYFDASKEVSTCLINNGYDLVFGCCNRGLMGNVYDEFKSNGSHIKAVCTEYYKDDLNNVDCEKVLVKDTMEQLNEFMKSDILVFLPGGYGTYNELFYMINAYTTESHKSDIIVINIDHYFDPVIEILSTIKKEKFAKVFGFVHVVSDSKELNALLGGNKCLSMEKM